MITRLFLLTILPISAICCKSTSKATEQMATMDVKEIRGQTVNLFANWHLFDTMEIMLPTITPHGDTTIQSTRIIRHAQVLTKQSTERQDTISQKSHSKETLYKKSVPQSTISEKFKSLCILSLVILFVIMVYSFPSKQRGDGQQ